MLDLKDYITKGYKFVIIGAIGAVVNWGLLYVFVQGFKIWYLSGEVLATVIAFVVNYNGNILIKNIHIAKSEPKSVTPPSNIVATNNVQEAAPDQPTKTTE
jgi:O-antigen/teichoic acid export membrane protein